MLLVNDSLDLGERLPHFTATNSSAQDTNDVRDFVHETGKPVLLEKSKPSSRAL
jgi:hypothetical protein